MDLQKLIYLEAIARLGSFTKAAAEQHISQPAITKAIKQLEFSLGVILIIRDNKGISLTPAGHKLLEWTHIIIKDFEAAEQEMSLYSSKTSISLKIGLSNRVGTWLLKEAYPSFLKLYPQIEFEMKEYSWTELLTMVKNEKLDMAYTCWERDFNDPRLHLYPLLDGELFVVLPVKHILSRQKRISLQTLSHYPLSVYSESSLIWKIVTEKYKQAGVTPSLISVTDHISTMLELVDDDASLGFVFMDRKTAQLNPRRYVLRPLEEPVPVYTGLITNADRQLSRIGKLFYNHIQEHLNE